jgi:opacity protein-like surface antigen
MTVSSRRGVAAAALTAGILTALTAGGSTAHAQALDTYPAHPFAVRFGLYMPSNGTTRDQLGVSFPEVGLSYDFRETGSRLPSTYSVYLDYFLRAKTTGPDNFRLRSQAQMFGVGIADRYYLRPANTSCQPYLGAGVGLYRARASSSDPGGSASEYKTAIGGKLLAGAEVRAGLFGEIEYNFLPEPKLVQNRVHLSGAAFRIGYRF